MKRSKEYFASQEFKDDIAMLLEDKLEYPSPYSDKIDQLDFLITTSNLLAYEPDLAIEMMQYCNAGGHEMEETLDHFQRQIMDLKFDMESDFSSSVAFLPPDEADELAKTDPSIANELETYREVVSTYEHQLRILSDMGELKKLMEAEHELVLMPENQHEVDAALDMADQLDQGLEQEQEVKMSNSPEPTLKPKRKNTYDHQPRPY